MYNDVSGGGAGTAAAAGGWSVARASETDDYSKLTNPLTD